MKYKLKDLDFGNIDYSLNQMTQFNKLNKMIDVKYLSEDLDFQTPKVTLQEIVKENGKEYLILKLLPTEACKTFLSRILLIENSINEKMKKHWFNDSVPVNNVNRLFNGPTFSVKIPMRFSKPQIDIYSNGKLFNYYRLLPGMELICLLSFNKVWINFDNVVTYNLTVKEILLV